MNKNKTALIILFAVLIFGLIYATFFYEVSIPLKKISVEEETEYMLVFFDEEKEKWRVFDESDYLKTNKYAVIIVNPHDVYPDGFVKLYYDDGNNKGCEVSVVFSIDDSLIYYFDDYIWEHSKVISMEELFEFYDGYGYH